MINKSISYRLSIFISLAVIIVFISFIIISYFFDQRLLKANIEHQAISESSKIIMEVKRLVVSTKEVSSNISDQILFYGAHNDTENFIRSVMSKYPFINSIHINIDSTVQNQSYHNFVCINEKDTISFKRLNQPLYHCNAAKENAKQVIQQNTSGWTEPFRCPNDEAIVVSYISSIESPVGNNTEKRVGEVISELSLLELNDSINSIKIGESKKGYAFLVSQKGDYITHPIKERILNRNLLTISDSVYDKSEIKFNEIIAEQKSGTAIVYSDVYDYEKTWVYYTPVQETGWLLVFVLPYNELFQPLYVMLLKLLFFSVIGILAIYFIITFITGKLVEPLSTVTTQLKKFSNLSGQTTVNTLNEVKLISESLDYLKDWYDNYRISQFQEKKKSLKQMQDLEQASEIQQSLIKTDFATFSKNNSINLFAIYKPARVVSGDLFDYFFIDDENFVFTVGDVSGKGIPAAIFMSIAQTIIKSSTTVKRAKNIVKKANSDLYTNNQHQFFLTLFVGVLNVKKGILNYCNAAHTSTLILKPNGQIFVLNHSHGLPLGLYPDKDYSDKKIQVERGDKLILYTDGITELQNKDRKQLGLEEFKTFIKETKDGSLEDFVTELENKIRNFQGEANQVDDITLFVIQY